jgi:hypothetical protein
MTPESEAPEVPAPEPEPEPSPAAPEQPVEPEPEPSPEPEPVPQSVKDSIKATKAAAKAGTPVEVTESFSTLVKGDEIHYRKGELIHPDDPVLSRSPELFRPVVYPHPIRRRGGVLQAPEVRA